MSTKNCKSCGKEIIWATTPAGKTMPIDAESETLWLLEGGVGICESRCRGVIVHRSHFATCPQADEHRKARQENGRTKRVDDRG